MIFMYDNKTWIFYMQMLVKHNLGDPPQWIGEQELTLFKEVMMSS